MNFILHPQLEKDCFFVSDLELCRVMAMDNANFPWLILVPCINGITETFELKANDRVKLTEEINMVSEGMKKIFSADKMNVAMLGNMVPQLHCHVIARFRGDSAWPNPVWGAAGRKYSPEEKEAFISRLQSLFISNQVA